MNFLSDRLAYDLAGIGGAIALALGVVILVVKVTRSMGRGRRTFWRALPVACFTAPSVFAAVGGGGIGMAVVPMPALLVFVLYTFFGQPRAPVWGITLGVVPIFLAWLVYAAVTVVFLRIAQRRGWTWPRTLAATLAGLENRLLVAVAVVLLVAIPMVILLYPSAAQPPAAAP